ncbi:MAG TPA: NAD(P)/FAD-dependent oxidoreductase [Deltaproteobacteria bacterium]|nr:NAD(P)/FAD-dependent oxidoreductase [Deltaproteobacteria bacterium]
MYDLVVIGGGPSGSSAARRAAEQGLKTLLLEKETFPRSKPCAGAVSRQALDSLDFALPHDIREKEIAGLRICYRGETIETRSDVPIAVTVTRSRFDDYLLGKAAEAGALVHTGEKVVAFEELEDRVVVRCGGDSYSTRYLVVGEGARMALGKSAGRTAAGKTTALSMVAETGASNSLIDKRLPGLIEIHVDLFRMGYAWIFPHDGYYSIGLWGFASYLKDPKGVARGFLRRTGFPEGLRFKGHRMSTGTIVRPLATGRVLMVGDAAGFTDPLTGEGISHAVRSGMIAADVAAEAARAGGFLIPGRYENACRKDFANNFIYAHVIARVLYRFPSFFYRVLARDEELFRMLMEVPATKGLYRDYVMWILSRFHRTILCCVKNRVSGQRL